MEYLLIPQRGDSETIQAAVEEFSVKSKLELVNYYNKQMEIGIVGVRGQALRLFALAVVFKKCLAIHRSRLKII